MADYPIPVCPVAKATVERLIAKNPRIAAMDASDRENMVLIAQEIAAAMLARMDCALLPPLESKPKPKASGYSGEVCQSCGGFYMVRTGTCLTCQSCGSTSGGCS